MVHSSFLPVSDPFSRVARQTRSAPVSRFRKGNENSLSFSFSLLRGEELGLSFAQLVNRALAENVESAIKSVAPMIDPPLPARFKSREPRRSEMTRDQNLAPAKSTIVVAFDRVKSPRGISCRPRRKTWNHSRNALAALASGLRTDDDRRNYELPRRD